MDRLLNVGEVAEVLRVSVHTLYAWVGEDRIPVVKLGRRLLFDPAELSRWLSECSRRERLGEPCAIEGTASSEPEPGRTALTLAEEAPGRHRGA
jgi:excisionase family DNA binding protein